MQEAAEQQDRFQEKLDMAMKESEQLKTSMEKIVEQKESERDHLQKEPDETRARFEKQTPPWRTRPPTILPSGLSEQRSKKVWALLWASPWRRGPGLLELLEELLLLAT